jgi:dynein heavy chain
MIDSIFVFAYIWSICCTVDYEGRAMFDTFIREQLEKAKMDKVSFPKDGAVYDFRFDVEKKAWVRWTDYEKDFIVDPKMSYTEVVVPTNATI